MTDTDAPAARLADDFWTSFRPEADSPLDVIAATEIVLAQALSLVCPSCRRDVLRDLQDRLPTILREADRIAEERDEEAHC